MVYTNNFGQTRLGIRFVSQVVNAVDADATAFIAAAGITNLTQAAAISTLVDDLKTYGIWSKMKAIYPMVGGSATSHKFNLKDPRDLDAAFRLAFSVTGWTHTSTGAKPNGTTGYADTKLNPSTNLTTNEGSLGFYSRTNNAGAFMCEIGAITTNPLPEVYFQIHVRFDNNYWYCLPNTSGTNVVVTTSDSTGFYQGIRLNSTTVRQIKNTTFVDNINSYAAPNSNVLIGSRTQNISNPPYSNRECAFAYIGNSLTTTDATNFYTAVQKYQTTLGRQVGVPIVADADAQAFLNAAVITDTTQASAINTLVTDLKAAGVWTKMKALYPFVGGTAAQHRFNLKDPRTVNAAFYLDFFGGGTHSATGYLPNGTTAYADTKLVPSSILSLNSTHVSYYSRTNISSIGSDFGTIGSSSFANNIYGYIKYTDGKTYFRVNRGGTPESSVSIVDSRLFYMINRISLTQEVLFTNSNKTTFSTNVNSTGLSPYSIYLGGSNLFGTGASEYSPRESAFASIGDGLTDAEAATFYTAVQKYQTTLGRHVGVPIVADTDAQAFLNAAVITDVTQANAVNTLVVDLKAAGVWTKMKALYPMVGGTATQHKFNLKDPRDLDAAFRLAFNGGWTHSSTGALPNGTTGYANTFLAPNAMSQNNIHVSFYSRTDTSGIYADIGAGAGNSYVEVLPKFNGRAYVYVHTSQGDYYDNPSSTGFYIANRIVYGTVSLFKNNTKIINAGRPAQTPTTYNLYLAAENGTDGNYSNRESAFASIGDGLTDGEATAFYTAVQKYQTTLGRQV